MESTNPESFDSPQYGPLGLNETLSIGGLGYVYEPEVDGWTHDYLTPEGYFAQHTIDAEDIHAIIAAGRYRVTPWAVPA